MSWPGATSNAFVGTPPVITTASLPGATVGAAYSASIAVSGGRLPLTIMLLSASPNTGGWLPIGTALPGGNITGTPSAAETDTVVVQVTDAAGLSAQRTLSIPVTAAATFAPNRPSGLTSLIDRQFAVADLPGFTMPHTDGYGMTWQTEDGPLGPFIGAPADMLTQTGLTVPLPPDNSPQFLCIQYQSGQAIGTAPFIVYWPHTFNTSQIYFCCYVFMPSSFNSNTNNIKWLGIEQHLTGGAANHLFMLSSNGSGVVSSGASGDYRGLWTAIQGGVNRSLGGANSDPSSLIQIVPGGGFTSAHLTAPGCWAGMSGQWVMCEFLAKQESNPGVSADGTYDAWTTPSSTGVTSHINSWNNVTWNATGDPGAFNIVTFAPYYGGGGSPAPSKQELFLGRFLVATR